MVKLAGIALVKSEFIHAGGRSPARLASYVLRAPVESSTTGERFDHSRQAADLVRAEVLLPTGASERFGDPGRLMSAAELADTTVDRKTRARRWQTRAQTIRHVIVALPGWPLLDDDRIELVRRLARRFTDAGAAVLAAIHRPTGVKGNNYHAHLLVTMRRIVGDKLGRKLRGETLPTVRGARGARGARFSTADGLRHAWREIQQPYYDERGFVLRVAPENLALRLVRDAQHAPREERAPVQFEPYQPVLARRPDPRATQRSAQRQR